MKHIFRLILAAVIFLSATPVPAMNMDAKAGMEEVKKKKKKKGKKISKGKNKKKKGFFSKVFGSK